MTEEAPNELEGVVSLTTEEEAEELPGAEAPKAEAEAKAEESSETGEKDPAAPEAKETDGVQRRINKLTAEKYETRAELEKSQKETEELRSRLAEYTQDAEPKIDDPDINFDQEKLIDAKVAYKLKQSEKQTPAGPQADPVKAEKVDAFNTKLDVFKQTHTDYVESVSKMPLGQIGADAILEMDNGPDVAYYLSQHLDVVDEVNTLNPVAAALKVAEISQKLKPAETKISAAPDPIESESTGGITPAKDVSEMSVAELEAYDNAQWKSKKQG